MKKVVHHGKIIDVDEILNICGTEKHKKHRGVTYSTLHEGRSIIHVVGGALTQDLIDNMGSLADWFVQNKITLLWGDDYSANVDKNHPVAMLKQEIAKRGGETPIRILQLGRHFNAYTSEPQIASNLEELYDDNGTFIGYHDKSIKEEYMIYTAQQQDRQKAYYNNADALMIMNGGLGAGYEIPSAFLYGFTKDVAPNFQIIILDNNHKFHKLLTGYLQAGDAKIEDFSQIKYYQNAQSFVQEKRSCGELIDEDEA